MSRQGTPIRAVLFDAAGTLIELSRPVGEVYAEAAAAFGVDLPAWRLEDAFGRILVGRPPLVFPDASPAEIDGLERRWWWETVRSTFLAADSNARFADFEGFFDALYAHFGRGGAWRATAGAQAGLAGLRERGLATGVVSNFDRRLRGILGALELAPLLDTVVLPSDVGAAKPAPAIFERALASLGVAGPETVFVGDDAEKDVAAAQAVGLRAVDVASLATLADLPARLLEPTATPQEPCA